MAGGPSLFAGRVGDLVGRSTVTCRPAEPIAAVARRMADERVGSVVVVDDAGGAIGIVTDRDLRGKVVAAARDPDSTRAADVMSAPLVTIAPSAFAFDALLAMTRRGIHHLVVVDAGALAGVVSTHDLLVHDTTHPVHLAGAIACATSIPALAELARRITPLVRRLVETGATAYDLGQLVAELNDRLVVAVLTIVDADFHARGEPAPVPYTWLAFGSEARREQTLATDQDNGLVYDDPPPELTETAAAYYRRLGAAAIDALVTIGVPRCPGDVMASNPRWCQPLATWSRYFRRWMDEPAPGPVLEAEIHFDMRPLGGAVALGGALRALIVEAAPRQRLFLGMLARDVVDRRVPLTMFGNVAVERRGPRRGAVDVKGGAQQPLTAAARVLALQLGREETNTVDRYRAAIAAAVLPESQGREASDAFLHVTRVRLVHQLEQLARGEAPDNFVRVDRLSRADGLLFRDALGTVQRVQAVLRDRFCTDLLG
jgi:CBS domain-containing protein